MKKSRTRITPYQGRAEPLGLTGSQLEAVPPLGRRLYRRQPEFGIRPSRLSWTLVFQLTLDESEDTLPALAVSDG